MRACTRSICRTGAHYLVRFTRVVIQVASKTPSQVLYDVLVARYKQSNERTSLPAEMELRETLGVAFRIKGRPDIAINAETVRSVVTGPSPGDRKTKKKRADTALFCYRGMCKVCPPAV